MLMAIPFFSRMLVNASLVNCKRDLMAACEGAFD